MVRGQVEGKGLATKLRLVDEQVGERIRQLRQAQELSLREVTDGHLSATYLSRIERGERVPSLEALILIAKALEVTALSLALGEENGCPYCGKIP